MFKYAVFNYNDKESVLRFYNFYQNIILDNFDFENIDSYQNFIEKLAQNELYNAIIIYREKELGGAIFEYNKSINHGIIHYLIGDNDKIKNVIYSLASEHINEKAQNYTNIKPLIFDNTPKKKRIDNTLDIVHTDDYFLEQLVIPAIKQKTYHK
ncbi:MAG: hypothetical protein IKE75_05240 [Bacilli bacterium]|nr:hypothetical protein [Bacilli bacterium]